MHTLFLLLHCNTQLNNYTVLLGLVADSDSRSVLLITDLPHNLTAVAVAAENSTTQRLDVGHGSRTFRTFVATLVYFHLDFNPKYMEILAQTCLWPPSFVPQAQIEIAH